MSAVAPDAAFVGRGYELGVLAAHLAVRDRPSGGVLLISGPAGVGKTALVDRALAGGAAQVVRGYCPAEPAPPLWPWRSALKRAGVEIAREPDIEPAAAASARFAALAQMSDALIAAGPLTVVLEDLHWADTASLDLLAHVGAVASGGPLTVVGTARSPAPESVAVRLAELGELVAERAEALGQPLAALIGHEWRIQAAYLSARLDIVNGSVTAIERLTRRSALPLARWHLHRLHASRAMLSGQFAESAEHSRRAFAIARDSGDAIAMSMHYAHGVRQAVVRGGAAYLPEGYREALARAPSMPLVNIERANVLVLTGSLRESRSLYDGLCGLLPFPAEHPAWPAVLTQMVDLIRLFGDGETAGIVYRQLLPFRPYPGALGTCTVYFMGTISRHLGELAEVLGDRDTAIGLLREALPRNQVIGARPDLALTSLDLARLLRNGPRPRSWRRTLRTSRPAWTCPAR